MRKRKIKHRKADHPMFQSNAAIICSPTITREELREFERSLEDPPTVEEQDDWDREIEVHLLRTAPGAPTETHWSLKMIIGLVTFLVCATLLVRCGTASAEASNQADTTQRFTVEHFKAAYKEYPEQFARPFEFYVVGVRDGWSLSRRIMIIENTDEGEARNSLDKIVQGCTNQYRENIVYSILAAPPEADENVVSFYLFTLLHACWKTSTDADIARLKADIARMNGWLENQNEK